MLQFCYIITTIALLVCLVSIAQAGQEKSVAGFSAIAGNMLNSIQELQLSLQEDSSFVELRVRLLREVEKLQVCRLLHDERTRNRQVRLQNGYSTARGSIKYYVDVTAGQMHVTQMARRLLEKHQFPG